MSSGISGINSRGSKVQRFKGSGFKGSGFKGSGLANGYKKNKILQIDFVWVQNDIQGDLSFT